MLRCANFLTCVVMLLVAVATPAAALVDESHLEDSQEVQAWFLGDRPVRWCVQLGSDIPAEESEKWRAHYEDVVTRATSTWREYVELKHVDHQQNTAARLANVWHRADCSENPDIRFYIGSGHEEADHYRSLYKNPSAFAQRTSLDDRTSWSRGFIWVLHDKANEARGPIDSLIVHEIGHVYGCEHIHGTIMDETIGRAYWVYVRRGLIVAPLVSDATIDQRKELFACERCSYATVEDNVVVMPSLREIMSRLTGRELPDLVRIEVSHSRSEADSSLKVSIQPVTSGEGASSAALKAAPIEFLIDFKESAVAVKTSDARAFRRRLRDWEYFIKPRGWTQIGMLRTPVGEEFSVILHRALGRQLQISVDVDTDTLVLYRLDYGRGLMTLSKDANKEL